MDYAMPGFKKAGWELEGFSGWEPGRVSAGELNWCVGEPSYDSGGLSGGGELGDA